MADYLDDSWAERHAPDRRKRLGQWATPSWLVEQVTAQLVAGLPRGATVLDPACGDARWLLALGRRRPDLALIGIDVDPNAILAAREAARRAGVHVDLRTADALSPSAPIPARVDLVVGNPPFVRPQNLQQDYARDLWSRFDTATNKSDLYCCFVERAVQLAEHMVLVLPENWLSLDSFRALRGCVREAGVDAIYRLPPRCFPTASVRGVLLVTGSRRERSGTWDRSGCLETGRLAFADDAWSLDGPLPQLTGPPLSSLVRVHMGVVCGDYARYVHMERRYPEDRLTCRGRDVHRWTIDDRDEYVRYLPRDMLTRKPYVAPKHAGLFDVPEKIVVAGTSGRTLRAAMDTQRRFPLDSCYILEPLSSGLDAWFVLGCLCSPQIGAWYGARYPAPRVKGVELRRLPLPPSNHVRIAQAARAADDEALRSEVEHGFTG